MVSSYRLSCILLLFCLFVYTSCNSPKKVAQQVPAKVLIGEYSKDWLKYKVYLLPLSGYRHQAKTRNVQLSIMVINMMDNVSPLRKRSADLDSYNASYDYLLNESRNELFLRSQNGLSYPVSYSYENNYNSFPFETINVGYNIQRRKGSYELVYIDRIFLQDTVKFSINL